MTLSVAIQMDPIERLRVAGDTGFALMLEAQARGHTLFTYTPDKLSMRDGKVTAPIRPVTVRDVEGDHFTAGAEIRTDLSTLDVVLLRQDPPFDMAYVSTTHMLERIHPKTLVVNDPFHVRNAPEKIFVTEFPDLMPETLITKDMAEVMDFRAEFGDIIMKPLYGNGGAGVFRMKEDDSNFSSLMEMFLERTREPLIAQAFLPAVSNGDKRIILVNGEAIGAINRRPKKGETRSNLHVGGTAEPVELTDADKKICDAIGPELRKRGQLFVGIDVIGDKLTEVNVTSPTGIQELKRFTGIDAAAIFFDVVQQLVAKT